MQHPPLHPCLPECHQQIWIAASLHSLQPQGTTNASTYMEGLARRKAHLTLLQEHSCTLAQQTTFKHKLSRDHGKAALLGPLDPNLSQPTAGIGAIAAKADSLFVLDALAPNFQNFVDLG